MDPAAGDPVVGDPVVGDPVVGDPVEEDPVEEDPVEEGPVEGGPVEGGPVEEDPVEEGLVEGGPVEGDPVEEGPVEEDPVEEDPVEEDPVEEDPVEEGLVEGGPVEGSPVEGGPVEEDPVEEDPVEEGLVEGGPVEGGPVEGGPVEGGPVEEDPVEGGPVEGGPVEGGPVERGPVEGDPVEGDPVEGNSVEGNSVEGNSVEGNSVEGNSVEGDAVEGNPGDPVVRDPVAGDPVVASPGTNYFLLPVGLMRAFMKGIAAILQGLEDLEVTMGLFLGITIPLALNVCIWSTIFKLMDCPLLTLWPNRFIVELLIPLGVRLNTSNEPSVCYGHIAGLTMIAIMILLIRIGWAALRWLWVRTPGLAWKTAKSGKWGWDRSILSIVTAAAGWRTYNYLFYYSELASKARWSFTEYFLNLLQQPALRYFQRKYCPQVEFFLSRELNFPLCATKTLGPYSLNSKLILLPWTQHSLTDGYLSMTGQKPEPWDDSNPLEIVLLWINFAALYFYFFEIFSYSYTVLPQQFLEAATVRKARILAFTSFQVLRLIFSILPRIILDFPSLILRPIHYPFRYLLRNTHENTKYVVCFVIYLGFINWWEVWMFLFFFPPQDEWELQAEFIVMKTFVYICGVVFYAAYWLVWYKEWSKYVIWPDRKADVELHQTVKGPRIDEFRRVLRYWDGFWRYDEESRKGSSLEYTIGFDASVDFCRYILRYSAIVAVHGWYLYCTAIILGFLAQVVWSQPVTLALTWEWVFWRLVAVPIFCWVVDEAFFGEEKIDRMSFALPSR